MRVDQLEDRLLTMAARVEERAFELRDSGKVGAVSEAADAEDDASLLRDLAHQLSSDDDPTHNVIAREIADGVRV